jgi:hypothetical protein
MNKIIAVSAGVLLAGMAWLPAAHAQGTWPGYAAPSYTTPAPAPRYVEPRRERELGYGSEMHARCGELHREAEMLRHRLDREWNPMERARTEGRLREVRERAERCR